MIELSWQELKELAVEMAAEYKIIADQKRRLGWKRRQIPEDVVLPMIKKYPKLDEEYQLLFGMWLGIDARDRQQ